MKKVLVSLFILTPALILSSCTTVSRSVYGPAYTGAYGPTYATTYSRAYVTDTYAPTLGYIGYGFDSWYGGTPDYYNTSLYIGDW